MRIFHDRMGSTVLILCVLSAGSGISLGEETAEIRAINKRIDELSEKLDALSALLVASRATSSTEQVHLSTDEGSTQAELEIGIDGALKVEEGPLRAVLSAIDGDESRIKVAPVVDDGLCGCDFSLKVPKASLEPRCRTTGARHYCNGSFQPVVEVRFKDGAWGEAFRQLARAARSACLVGREAMEPSHVIASRDSRAGEAELGLPPFSLLNLSIAGKLSLTANRRHLKVTIKNTTLIPGSSAGAPASVVRVWFARLGTGQVARASATAPSIPAGSAVTVFVPVPAGIPVDEGALRVIAVIDANEEVREFREGDNAECAELILID